MTDLIDSESEETWTDDNRNFECPHCHEMNDYSDDFENIYTEDEFKTNCGHCDKPIEIYGSCSWSWSVYKGDQNG